jgi:hypothetical protein
MTIRATALTLFLIVLASVALPGSQYPLNAQVVTRLGLAVAIVEDGQVTIDRFASHTIDKAQIGEHFYADKVPGQSLLALPLVALALPFVGDIGTLDTPEQERAFERLADIVTPLLNGLLAAVAVAVFYLTAIRLGATEPGALFGAVALGLGSPFFGWSTAFFAHSISASLLILGFSAIAFTLASPGRPRAWAIALTGVLLGYTVVVDLTSAPVVGLAGLTALVLIWRNHRSGVWPQVGILVAGGIVGVLPLLIYNQIAFASPFKLGYGSVVGFEGMQQGFFGVTWPRPGVVVQLILGEYRGLLPMAPVLLLVPLGLWRLWRTPGRRGIAVVILLASLSYLWINASYFYWQGGWSTGPRHLVPALPFLAMALAFSWPNRFKWVSLALLAVSCLIWLLAISSDMFSPEEIRATLVDHLLPTLVYPGVQLQMAMGVVLWVVGGLVLLRRGTVSGPMAIDRPATR